MANDKPVPPSSNAGSQKPESFEATVLRMLDHALTLHSAERSLATREIRECVKCVVAHAKARGLQAEHMIIEVKHACHGLESASQKKSEVIPQLVTMCIHEFYDADAEQPGS